MSATPPVRLLLVEDNQVAAIWLAEAARELGYDVLGPAATFEEALRLYETAQPPVALALLDIKLKGSRDGIALAEVLKARQDLPIIFITALPYGPTYQRARLVEPAAFLPKTCSRKELQVTLELALNNFNRQGSRAVRRLKEETAAAPLAETNRSPLWVREQGGTLFPLPDSICYVKADDQNCVLHTATTTHPMRRSLKQLREKLPSDLFIQTHRSYLVQLACIEALQEGKLLVAGQLLPVGRRYRDALLNRLPTLR